MNRKQILPLAILVITLFILYRVFLGSNGMINQYFIARNNQQLQVAIDSLNNKLILKQREIIRLKQDTSYLEFIARTKFGMSLKDEQVIKFVDQDSIHN